MQDTGLALSDSDDVNGSASGALKVMVIDDSKTIRKSA